MDMRFALVTGLVALLVVSATLAAQPYGTDLFASSTSRFLIRISPTGQVSTVVSGIAAIMNMVAMDNDNQNVVICQTSPPTLYRVDPVQNAIVGTIFQGSPLSYIQYFNPTSTGDFLLAEQQIVWIIKGNGSAATSIRSGAPFQYLQGCIQDLNTGHYAMGDINADAIFLVANDGTLVTTYSAPGVNPFSLTQDHRDGAFIVGHGGGGKVFRVDPLGAVTTVFSASANFNAICFDRWSGNGEIVGGTTVVYRLTIGGVVVKTHPGIPSTNSGMCFDKGRNVVPVKVGSPNHYRIDLNFPGFAGKTYVLAMSLTGFAPGIPVGGRVVQLVPDDLFVLSVKGLLAPVLANNVGVLDPFARASATLDLRSFGNLLSGLRVWTAAVVVEPLAPGSLGAISKPYVIPFE